MAKKDKMENLISFKIRDDFVQVGENKFYFYRFYPPNTSILTEREMDIEISSLCQFFESANRPIDTFAMDKVEDLSRNKEFFSNMSETYKEYTDQIVEQISSYDANDKKSNSIQRAYYFIISVKADDERQSFEEALQSQNMRYSKVKKQELITVFRNYYLREFSTFDIYFFGKELMNKYDNASKRTK